MAARKIKLTHQGKILREEFMEQVGPSADALAKSLDVPLPRVNDNVREKRAISPDMAVLLSAYFGTTDGYWINLQAHYDLEMARDRVGSMLNGYNLTRITRAERCSRSEQPAVVSRSPRHPRYIRSRLAPLEEWNSV